MLRRSVFIAGMILNVGSMAVTASAQGPRGGMFFGRGPSAMLLGMPEVQKELNLSDDQKKQVDALLADARASFGPGNRQDLRDLSQEERDKRRGEMLKKFEAAGKALDEKAGKILDTKQSERLHQLQLQREGAMALSRAEVIQKLSLSDEQQAKIKKIQDDLRPAGRPAYDPNQTDEERQAARKKMREKFESAQKDCLAVLNDDQMLDWTNMCGKAFKFPERQGFRRGNRQAPSTTPPQ